MPELSTPDAPTQRTAPRRGARVTMMLLACLSLAWLALALPLYSHPMHDGVIAALHAAPGLLLIAPAWLIAALLVLRSIARGASVGEPGRLAVIAAVTPACGVLGVFMLVTDLDMRLRFRLSESRLAGEADRVRNLPERWDNRPRWVGLFRVHHAQTDQNDAVLLVTNNTHLFGEAGFIHAPAGPPAPDPLRRDQHLSDLRGTWHAYFIVD